MSSQMNGAHAGDIDAQAAWLQLKSVPEAQLVDVRTREEWTFVGVPDLAELGKQALLVEWQSWPAMNVGHDFLDRLRAGLKERGVSETAPLFFLCRSGARSAAAAATATASGFGPSYNVVGGFEGPHDADRHRGAVEGWKARGLPWLQT